MSGIRGGRSQEFARVWRRIGAPVLATLLLMTAAARADQPPLAFDGARCSRAVVLGVTGLADQDGKPIEDNQIATAAIEQAGCTVEIRVAPWARLVELVRSGGVDVVPYASRTEERESFARFSEPYKETVFQMLIRRTDTAANAGAPLDQLVADGFVIATTRGAYYGPRLYGLAEQYPERFVALPETDQDRLRLLGLDRIDGFVLEEPFASQFVARQEELRLYPEPVFVDRLHLMMSRRTVDADAVARLDKALSITLGR